MAKKQCSICGGKANTYLVCQKETLLQCMKCGIIILKNIPPQKIVNSYYGGGFYDEQGERFHPLLEKLVFLFRYGRARKVIQLAGKGRVLDVGFSRGIMLSLLRERGWESYGITNSRNVFLHGKKIRIRVRHGELPKASFPSAFFDIITFWHVLEHVRGPILYIRECRRILKPGGVVIIEVPNIGSTSARWFRCNWLGLDLPRHLYHFTPASLQYLLEKEHFFIRKIQYFSLEHSIPSLLFSMVKHMTGAEESMLESIKKQSTFPAGKKLYTLLLALLLLPVATVLAVLFALGKQGDIMRVIAVKNKKRG
ncbi:class I SAM-dependent methyltransferase [Candidatus Woesearchaeota archaeon]|nr:class I SAM-dependent methyltransferase [Candidatus Woesearchaeota archaeon]